MTELAVFTPGTESRIVLCLQCKHNSSVNPEFPLCRKRPGPPCHHAAAMSTIGATCPHEDPEYAARWAIATLYDVDGKCQEIDPILGLRIGPVDRNQLPEDAQEDDTLIGVASAPIPPPQIPNPPPPQEFSSPPARRAGVRNGSAIKVYLEPLQQQAAKPPAPTSILEQLTVYSFPMPPHRSLMMIAYGPPNMAVYGLSWGELEMTETKSQFTMHYALTMGGVRRRGVMSAIQRYIFNNLQADQIRVLKISVGQSQPFIHRVGYSAEQEEHVVLTRDRFQSYLNSRKTVPV